MTIRIHKSAKLSHIVFLENNNNILSYLNRALSNRCQYIYFSCLILFSRAYYLAVFGIYFLFCLILLLVVVALMP